MSNPNNSHGVEHPHYPLEDQSEKIPTGQELIDIVNNQVGQITGVGGDISAEIRRKAGFLDETGIPENPFAKELKAANDSVNKKVA